MSTPGRLRLTLIYMAVLAVIVGVLSLALGAALLRLQEGAPHTMTLALHAEGAPVAVITLVMWVVVIDLSVLALGAAGAYALAGYTLRPVTAARERQQRFAVAASHELRTPLTVLQGTLEAALLRPRTPAQYEDVVRRATSEAERLGALLAALLTLAHDEGGVGEPAVHAQGKGQTLTVALEEPLPVRGDGRALGQAITALLDNAVTYTPVGGTLHLVGRRARGRVTLTLRDNGPGIAPEHLRRLFEPFYRVNSAYTGAREHSGLGLAYVAHITHVHRGRLSVTSQLGAGSAFTLTLPLARSR